MNDVKIYFNKLIFKNRSSLLMGIDLRPTVYQLDTYTI